MIELKCPNEWNPALVAQRGYGNLWDVGSLFLGGGITSCPQWQPIMVDLLKDTELVLVNPRRDNFDVTQKGIQEEQISWEYKYLRAVTGRMFWFPKETLCPITLFELGKYIEKTDALFVGCDIDYGRREDLLIQMGLARPWAPQVHYTLDGLAESIRNWAKRVCR